MANISESKPNVLERLGIMPGQQQEPTTSPLLGSIANNPFIAPLLSTTMMNIGDAINQAKNADKNTSFYKQNYETGGMVKANVEGGEAYEDPNGNVGMFKGPKHEQGGIDKDLEKGTKIYSKSLSVDGQDMASRKLKREKALKRIEKFIGKGDNVGKNTLARMKMISQIEEAQDMAMQEMAKNIYSTGGRAMYKYGSEVGEFDFANEQGSPIGNLGTMMSGISPLIASVANRMQDKPNINPYQNYGIEAKKAMEGTETSLKMATNEMLKDADVSENEMMNSNRNNSRSLNVMRSLDLNSISKANDYKSKLMAAYAERLSSIGLSKAQILNQIDQTFGTGEQYRTEADIQDRDKFYSSIGQNMSRIGTSLQHLAGNVNKKNMAQQAQKDVANTRRFQRGQTTNQSSTVPADNQLPISSDYLENLTRQTESGLGFEVPNMNEIWRRNAGKTFSQPQVNKTVKSNKNLMFDEPATMDEWYALIDKYALIDEMKNKKR
jgi:hypothetical protein